MPDITTRWAGVSGDWAVAGADLAAGDDLATAVLISLGTDRLAGASDELLDGSDDPRGWWGDDGEAYPIGSKIWLRRRSKRTRRTLDLVADDCREALQWLLDDRVASSVEVATSWAGSRLEAVITISRADGSAETLRYAWVWEAG